jgi:hypothetical protein
MGTRGKRNNIVESESPRPSASRIPWVRQKSRDLCNPVSQIHQVLYGHSKNSRDQRAPGQAFKVLVSHMSVNLRSGQS